MKSVEDKKAIAAGLAIFAIPFIVLGFSLGVWYAG